MKKGSLEISFTWLFAIIIGIIILGFAIYAATKIVNTGQYQSDAEAQKNLEVIMSPLETNFESSVVNSISLTKETKIGNSCESKEFLGKQIINLSQKSFGEWSEGTQGSSIKNKYIFSENDIEGKTFFVFSKPFEFPFKIADLIYLIPASEEYCFVGAPEDIEEEILNLKSGSLSLNFILENCSIDSTKVCFNKEGCEIYVDYDSGYLKKEDYEFYFEGDALMYAAIFGEKGIYECNIKRLMQKTEVLVDIYLEKEDLISNQGCEKKLSSDLISFKNLIKEVSYSRDLPPIIEDVMNLEKENKNLRCVLW